MGMTPLLLSTTPSDSAFVSTSWSLELASFDAGIRIDIEEFGAALYMGWRSHA
jgi:hypothetical protein